MRKDPRDTQISDIAVEFRGVKKGFKQRQRAQSLTETFKQLLRPKYKSIQALNDVDLTVRRGEILAYAGPNGAGKSTTIKLIAGLLSPDNGSVRALGVVPTANRASYVSQVAVVFGQRTELWWDHSVSASFRWKRAMWGIDDATYEQTVAELRERFDLDDIWKSLARELSLGQRMRADLALSLLHRPKLVLLDEPTLGLDVIARRRMLDYICELNQRDGLTIFITSHNMADLEDLGARIVLIDHGSVAFDGTFQLLRQSVGDWRILRLALTSPDPPAIKGASLVSWHAPQAVYEFDARAQDAAEMLSRVSALALSDVSIERASIDSVMEKVYGRLADAKNSGDDLTGGANPA